MPLGFWIKPKSQFCFGKKASYVIVIYFRISNPLISDQVRHCPPLIFNSFDLQSQEQESANISTWAISTLIHSVPWYKFPRVSVLSSVEFNHFLLLHYSPKNSSTLSVILHKCLVNNFFISLNQLLYSSWRCRSHENTFFIHLCISLVVHGNHSHTSMTPFTCCSLREMQIQGEGLISYWLLWHKQKCLLAEQVQEQFTMGEYNPISLPHNIWWAAYRHIQENDSSSWSFMTVSWQKDNLQRKSMGKTGFWSWAVFPCKFGLRNESMAEGASKVAQWRNSMWCTNCQNEWLDKQHLPELMENAHLGPFHTPAKASIWEASKGFWWPQKSGELGHVFVWNSTAVLLAP